MLKKLLVVDDEKGITRLVEKIAAELGFVVQAVNDPAAAVETFESFAPDILLLDLMMPDVDGIDILNQILLTGTTARIVVMSGYGTTYLQLGAGVGIVHERTDIKTLAKPFRRADLVALLAPHAAAKEGV